MYNTYTEEFDERNLDEINLSDFAPSNLGWAIASLFPTKDYREAIEKLAPSVDPAPLCNWQEDEDYRDYIDTEAYLSAPIEFVVTIDEEMPFDDESLSQVKIRLRARSQEDIDAMVDIIEETVTVKVEIVSAPAVRVTYGVDTCLPTAALALLAGSVIEVAGKKIYFSVKNCADPNGLVDGLNKNASKLGMPAQWKLA